MEQVLRSVHETKQVVGDEIYDQYVATMEVLEKPLHRFTNNDSNETIVNVVGASLEENIAQMKTLITKFRPYRAIPEDFDELMHQYKAELDARLMRQLRCAINSVSRWKWLFPLVNNTSDEFLTRPSIDVHSLQGFDSVESIEINHTKSESTEMITNDEPMDVSGWKPIEFVPLVDESKPVKIVFPEPETARKSSEHTTSPSLVFEVDSPIQPVDMGKKESTFSQAKRQIGLKFKKLF